MLIANLKAHISACIRLLDDYSTTEQYNYSGSLIWIKCTLKTILNLLNDEQL